jgi:hypothetical protein
MPDTPNGDLFDRLAEDFTGDGDVVMGTMFRSPGLRVRGKIFAFLGHRGGLIVKVPGDRIGELVAAGTGEQVVMGRRTMREWIEVPAGADRTATLALWRDLAREAHQYVGSR